MSPRSRKTLTLLAFGAAAGLAQVILQRVFGHPTGNYILVAALVLLLVLTQLARLAPRHALEQDTTATETHVEFRSDRFPPYEGEGDQINPGRHGRRLAEFLASGLRAKGFEAGEPGAEDWGWLVPVRNDAFPLWVGCGNYEEYPDGFLCFIQPHKAVIRRWFRKIDTTARVAELRDAIDQVLTDAGVRDKRWWTREAFNGGKT